MYERLMSERNYNPLNNEEVATPMEPDSPEYSEMQFLFNTMFNESSGRLSSNELGIYEIEKAYSLKNQYISLNFQKRQINEVSSYGWYESENYDDKKLDEQVIRLKSKGLEKIKDEITAYGWYESDNYDDKKTDEQVLIFKSKGLQKIKDEIKVSAPNNKEPDRYTIIICKFIVGKSEIIFQDQELTEEAKEQYRNNFDTIVRILNKSNNKENIKNYNVLREENIELLYQAARSKDNIEQYKESYFIPFRQLTNFNCSDGIIQDEQMMEVAKIFGINFDDYFGELCKEFPVASTGVPINIIYEIVYMTGKLYRKFEPADDFNIIYEEHLNDLNLYKLLTLTLVFFRFQRNFFYDKVLMKEVNSIMNYFSRLILLYLVFCIIFESVVFLIFYFGIILQVKKKDKLFNNFIESFKYD